jgi:hypothetical protein
MAADPDAERVSDEQYRRDAEAQMKAQRERGARAANLNQPVERPHGVAQSEEDAREVDAEAAEKMLSAEEQKDVRIGQGESFENLADVHVSSVDPNRALDLPAHMVTGDMKEDAKRAFVGADDPKVVMGARPSGADRIAGQADEQPKGEGNPS